MDAKKLKAFKDLGVDIDSILNGAEKVQKKADKTASYRMKSTSAEVDDDEEEIEDDDSSISSKLDRLTAQMASLKDAMKEGDTLEPDEKLEDLMVRELTVGELQDIISSSIAKKSAEPVGLALKAIMEELQEIKEILTSKSVQSVVDEVARMKAKLERQTARVKAIGSKIRDLDDDQPRILQRGVRPSTDDRTILDDDDDADLTQKADQNLFSLVDSFIQKPDQPR